MICERGKVPTHLQYDPSPKQTLPRSGVANLPASWIVGEHWWTHEPGKLFQLLPAAIGICLPLTACLKGCQISFGVVIHCHVFDVPDEF